MSRYTFQRERVFEVWDEAERLFALHYEELTFGKGVIRLAPDRRRYEKLDADNSLEVYTAREDGKLVGYAAFFVMPHPHYMHNLYAMNDVFYLDPEKRTDPWLGFRFLKYIDAHLTGDDQIVPIDAIKWHVKVFRDFGPMLRRLGYEPEETIWSKVRKGK